MSRGRQRQPASLGDRVALEIQALHRRGRLRDAQPLLRIDQRQEAASAPFQFDAVRGRLHRSGCRAIPASSKSALYGVWDFRPNERHLACSRCKPMPTTGATRTKKKPTRDVAAPGSDLVYGLLSILDQFGGVLRERGREYRRSQSGGPFRGGMHEIYESLGQGEQDMLHVIASALDGLSAVVNDLQRSLATNGNGQHAGRVDNGNDGIHANGRRPTSARRSRNGTDEP